MAIEVGDLVKLKTKSLSEIGIERNVQGGEATVVEISEDSKGTVYRVRLHRNDRIRAARKEQFVIHRKPKPVKKKRKRL